MIKSSSINNNKKNIKELYLNILKFFPKISYESSLLFIRNYDFTFCLNFIISLEAIASTLNLIGLHDEANKYYNISYQVKNITNEKFKYKNHIFFKHEDFKAIGHIALIGVFIKSNILKINKNKKIIILGPLSNYANPDLLYCFSNFVVFDDISNYEQIDILVNSASLSGNFQNKKFIYFDKFYSFVQENWEKNNFTSLIKIKDQKKIDSVNFLKSFGIGLSSHNANYIVLHVRYDEKDKENLRNANIENYIPSMKYLIKKGFHIIRIGDPGMPIINFKNNKFIDLTRIDYKKHIPFIFENCFLSICTGSGPSAINYLFDKPTLLTNWAPLSSALGSKKNITLPKMYYLKDKIISLNERLEGKYATAEYNYEKNINVIENTPYEILSSTIEFFNYVKNDDFPVLSNNRLLFFKRKNIYPFKLPKVIYKNYKRFDDII